MIGQDEGHQLRSERPGGGADGDRQRNRAGVRCGEDVGDAACAAGAGGAGDDRLHAGVDAVEQGADGAIDRAGRGDAGEGGVAQTPQHADGGDVITL